MNKLPHYRNKAGLSQEALGALCGWRQGRIGHYETGRRTPSLDDSRRIVKALKSAGVKCTLDDVFPASK